MNTATLGLVTLTVLNYNMSILSKKFFKVVPPNDDLTENRSLQDQYPLSLE